MAPIEISFGVAWVFMPPPKGSSQNIHVNYWVDCGTKIALTFARWSSLIGIFAGTFDKSEWFEMSPNNTKDKSITRYRYPCWFPYL